MQGNVAYHSHDYTLALECYRIALENNQVPQDVLLNLASVYFEVGSYYKSKVSAAIAQDLHQPSKKGFYL